MQKTRLQVLCAHQDGCWVSSAVTGEKFQARTTTNCKTSNVVYLIECRKCKLRGKNEESPPFKVDGHRSNYYWRLPDKPIRMGMHFNTLGHTFDDLTVVIIEQMHVASATHRKNWESFWIRTLRSLAPHSLSIESQALECHRQQDVVVSPRPPFWWD